MPRVGSEWQCRGMEWSGTLPGLARCRQAGKARDRTLTSRAGTRGGLVRAGSGPVSPRARNGTTWIGPVGRAMLRGKQWETEAGHGVVCEGVFTPRHAPRSGREMVGLGWSLVENGGASEGLAGSRLRCGVADYGGARWMNGSLRDQPSRAKGWLGVAWSAPWPGAD